MNEKWVDPEVAAALYLSENEIRLDSNKINVYPAFRTEPPHPLERNEFLADRLFRWIDEINR